MTDVPKDLSIGVKRFEAVRKILNETILRDRAQLLEWAKMPSMQKFWVFPYGEAMSHHFKIGGAEAISLKLQHVLLDLDGDGNLSDDEIIQSIEEQKKNVDQALNLLINCGVVAALIFSVLYNTVLSPLSASDTSIEFFGDEGITALEVLYEISVISALGFSICNIYCSVRYYLYLSVWMPTIDMQAWFLSERSTVPITFQVNISIILTSIAVIFGIAVNNNPRSGFIALLVFVIVLITANSTNKEGELLMKLHELAKAELLPLGNSLNHQST